MNKSTVRELCPDMHSGGTPSTKHPEYWNGDIPWLSSAESGNEYITKANQFITQEGVDNSATRFADKGSIIIATAGEGKTRGQVSFLKIGAYINQSLIAMKTDEKTVLTKYLYYYLKNNYGKLRSLSDITGVRGSLSGALLGDYVVSYPELSSQVNTVELLSTIDDKISNNTAICSNLEAAAKLLYDYWFVQFDFPDENGKPYKSSGGKMVRNEELKREIPEGWEVKTISDYCRIFTGKKDVNQASDKGKYKFYSCAPEYRFSDDKLYEGKAILVSGNGSYTGRTIFVNDAFDLYQRTYACTPLSEIVPLVYVYYSMLRFFVPVVGGGTHGSAIPYIVYGDIADHTILYNQKTVNEFEHITENLQEKIIALQAENQQLASLRDFLLPMLMNGQVSIKDIR